MQEGHRGDDGQHTAAEDQPCHVGGETANILAATVMLPIYGRLCDLMGRKGIFIAAITVFILGSII